MVHWYPRILAARKRGHFTDYDRSLADSWSSCAISESPKLKGLVSNWTPDEMLPTKLGIWFANSIWDNDFDRALKLWRRIKNYRVGAKSLEKLLEAAGQEQLVSGVVGR